MATYPRITYSRKRRLPPDFEDDAPTPSTPTSSPPVPALREPLRDRSANLPTPPLSSPTCAKPSATIRKPASKSKRRLTQLTIDLGGNPHRKCKVCGMEYIHTNAEDAALHKQFHISCLAGLEVPKVSFEKMRVVWRGERRLAASTGGHRGRKGIGGAGSRTISEVDRRDGVAVRNFARKVLRVAEKELGAVEIEEGSLWSTIPMRQREDCCGGREGDASTSAATTTAAGEDLARPQIVRTEAKCDRYKLYLYVEDSKCVGLCLAERICEARKVLGNSADPTQESSCITTEAGRVFAARLGISRIWVSREHRGAGVATGLVDAAREHFVRGVLLAKEAVAWSQPTESGARFARKYSQRTEGWLLYDEQSLDREA